MAKSAVQIGLVFQNIVGSFWNLFWKNDIKIKAANALDLVLEGDSDVSDLTDGDDDDGDDADEQRPYTSRATGNEDPNK